jgi:hypothetical protein
VRTTQPSEGCAGGLLSPSVPPGQAASLYFYVNRAETERWFLRTCELRTLSAVAAAHPQAAVHAGFVWLRQLLTALQHLAAASAEASSTPPGNNEALKVSSGKSVAKESGKQVAEDQARAEPQKTVKILRAPQGPAVLLPRSVVKVSYRRTPPDTTQPTTPTGRGEKPGQAKETASKAVPPLSQKSEPINPLKMPRRLVASMVQLLAALTTALAAMRDDRELWRLYRVCTAAIATAMDAISPHDSMRPKDAQIAESSDPVGGSPRHATERLLGFVLAAVHEIAGRYEVAATQYLGAAEAAAAIPGLPTRHAAMCRCRAAACYAALTDWEALSSCALAPASFVSPGVASHCAQLQGMNVWSLPEAPTDVDLVPHAMSAQVHLSAVYDGAFARSQRLLQDLFPSACPNAVALVPTAVQALERELAACLDAISHTNHTASPAMSAELLACLHTAAATVQLLESRLPPGQPPPTTPGWLSAACASMDACQHLLAASELLTCGHSRMDASTGHMLVGQAALSLQLTLTARSIHVDDNDLGALDARQLPLHMHVFSAASTLASAREYGVGSATVGGRALPGKEAVLQVRSAVG